jgi:cytochrome P450
LARNPYSILKQLQQEEPVSWIEELNLWFITRRADIIDILLDPATFTVASSESLLEDTIGATMLSTDGKGQQRLRQPFYEAFLPKAVRASMTHRITTHAQQLIDRFANAGQVELRAAFADPLALQTVAGMLGLPIKDFAKFRGWFTAIAEALGNYGNDEHLRLKGRAAAAEFSAVVPARIARLANENSVLGHVCRAPQPLTEQEVVSAACVIIFGGLETTAALLLNTVWALLNHPQQYAAVRADQGLLPSAIHEALRWEAPVQTCTRQVTRPVQVQGVEMTPGDVVQCIIGAANRDPAHFADPDVFDIYRDNARDHLSFGLGKHYCLGAFLARLEGEIGLRLLFEKLPNLRIDPEKSTPPQGHEFRSPPRLTVRWG